MMAPNHLDNGININAPRSDERTLSRGEEEGLIWCAIRQLLPTGGIEAYVLMDMEAMHACMHVTLYTMWPFNTHEL